ncbi:MAG: DNA-3-methyladenine glycosylase I [Candidatus Omnitrophica bacterium]|nr:DNA-3-methyladenine glycosylase I [Candidatus Omnitrophota bacterium]MDD5672085.1 DNA-3-methyladenine glycosylase I [Candidatus Omnitrophota bacterium]
MRRCWPLANDDRRMIDYHDKEWGRPVHDDRKHFEYLLLDAFQAGLSWRTILNKRENFKKAFSRFNPEAVARYDERKIKKLLSDAGIIRNRLKISGAVRNAKAFLKIQSEFGSFDKYIWQFTNDRTIPNKWRHIKELPAKTKESDAMSRDLKKRGFTFVGSTICYAYMQAAGLVNDHLIGCPRHGRSQKN